MHGSWQARISGRKFSLTTVVVLVALLVAMSGTAVATTALLVTKNKQVAPHVIAGANAPRGDNQNLVPGSVGSSDLHSGAVTGKAIANGSVSSAKLTFPSCNSKVDATPDGVGTPPVQKLATAGPLTLSYQCAIDGGGATHLYLLASSTATPSTFNGVSLSSSPIPVDTLSSGSPGTASVSGFETYVQGTHVTAVFMDRTAFSAATNGYCKIDGLALPSN